MELFAWALTLCSRFSRWDLCGCSSFSPSDLFPRPSSLWLVSKPSVTCPPLCAPDQLSLCLITKSTNSSRRSCRKSSPSVRSSLTRFRGTFLHGGTVCGCKWGTSQRVYHAEKPSIKLLCRFISVSIKTIRMKLGILAWVRNNRASFSVAV